jgi:hypothetical protein
MSLRRTTLLTAAALLVPAATADALTSRHFSVSVQGTSKLVLTETDTDSQDAGCRTGETVSTGRFRTTRPARVLVTYDSRRRRVVMQDEIPRTVRTTAAVTQSAIGFHDSASPCRTRPSASDCGTRQASRAEVEVTTTGAHRRNELRLIAFGVGGTSPFRACGKGSAFTPFDGARFDGDGNRGAPRFVATISRAALFSRKRTLNVRVKGQTTSHDRYVPSDTVQSVDYTLTLKRR